MATRERAYTVDDVWRLEVANENPLEKYYLIDGELCIKMAPSELHGETANLIAHYLTGFVLERALGRVGVEVGFHPPGDRRTALLPDVSFISKARMSRRARASYVPRMPDLAVELVSPSQSLAQVRRKAETYLRHGTALVWLIDPEAKTAEVWQPGTERREVIDLDGELAGGDILPGFSLPLKRLFRD
ncbi:MAG: Uma2 family endonuclease [Chloroflexi bacterium]|nr:Uma2 family endonuclease [Chloroflexota bacterium]